MACAMYFKQVASIISFCESLFSTLDAVLELLKRPKVLRRVAQPHRSLSTLFTSILALHLRSCQYPCLPHRHTVYAISVKQHRQIPILFTLSVCIV